MVVISDLEDILNPTHPILSNTYKILNHAV